MITIQQSFLAIRKVATMVSDPWSTVISSTFESTTFIIKTKDKMGKMPRMCRKAQCIDKT